MSNLFTEFKRRNIFKVATAYLVVGWLTLQVFGSVAGPLGFPEWINSFIIVLIGVGFPIALIFAWAFEMTPDGIKPTSAVDAADSIAGKTSQKINFIIIGALVLIIGGMAYTGKFSSSSTQGEKPDAIEGAKTVAVLPFVDMSPDQDQDWFSDGLTEEILNSLAMLPELRVTARTSSFFFKGQNIPIPEIADKLNVTYVVEGSVRRAGDTLRITAQIIRAEDDYHLWSNTYDKSSNDVLKVQSDVAEKIAKALDVVLDDERRQRMLSSGTRNVEAFEAYLKGSALASDVHNFKTDKNLWDANAYFQKAINTDPSYAAPYSAMQDAYAHFLLEGRGSIFVKNGHLGGLTDTLAYKQMHYYLAKAIELAPSPTLKLQHEFTKVGLSDDWRRLPSLMQELEGNADYYEVGVTGWLAELGFATGRPELIIEKTKHRLKSNPYYAFGWVNVIEYHVQRGEIDSALDVLAEARSKGIISTWVEDTEFFILMALNNDEKIAQKLLNNPSSLQTINAIVLAYLGRDEEAREILNALSEEEMLDANNLLVYHLLGEQEKANALARQIDQSYLGVLQFAYVRTISDNKLPVPVSVAPNYVRKLRQSGLSEEKIQSMFLSSDGNDE